MTTGIDGVLAEIAGLQRADLERWILQDWVRADGPVAAPVFQDIDIARVRLIVVLRDELELGEAALPVVLSLLDQLHDLRRRLHELGAALERIAPDELRARLAVQLAQKPV
jgi:chaperone modulatory protein CbpM